MGDVTRDDLRELRTDLGQQMAAGFGRTNDTLDEIRTHLRELNGRTGKTEVATAGHGVKIANLEREVFAHRRHPAEPGATSHPSEGDNRRLTKWDAIVFATGGASLVAAWKFLEWAIAHVRVP